MGFQAVGALQLGSGLEDQPAQPLSDKDGIRSVGFGPSHSFSGPSCLTSCPETFPAPALHKEQPFGPILRLRREIFITSSRVCSHKDTNPLTCFDLQEGRANWKRLQTYCVT